MVSKTLQRSLLCVITIHTTYTTAQYGPGGQYGPDSNNNGGNNNNYGQANNNNGAFANNRTISTNHKALLAHAILASLAFIAIFPTGSILIRLSTHRRAYLIHAALQITGYIIYTTAFGLGVYLLHSIPRSINILTTPQSYHPIIGIVLFAALFFQPVLGWIHHARYKKVGRRTGWSYGHIWFGRVLITLGMINGGLGLLLASNAPGFTGFAPTRGQCIAYGVVAGGMWVVWVGASIVGERRRANVRMDARIGKELERGSDGESAREEERGGTRGYDMVEMGVSTPPAYKERDGRFA